MLQLNPKETLYFSNQEALITSKAEALRWQNLYEELKLNSEQLREKQQLSNEQLQQLHSQVEVQYPVAMCVISFHFECLWL